MVFHMSIFKSARFCSVEVKFPFIAFHEKQKCCYHVDDVINTPAYAHTIYPYPKLIKEHLVKHDLPTMPQ